MKTLVIVNLIILLSAVISYVGVIAISYYIDLKHDGSWFNTPNKIKVLDNISFNSFMVFILLFILLSAIISFLYILQ